MGRRKKSTSFGVTTKPKEKLPTAFDCPFCSATEAVSCTLNKDKLVGVVKCDVCQESFATGITELSEPVDVYCDWIDACEDAN